VVNSLLECNYGDIAFVSVKFAKDEVVAQRGKFVVSWRSTSLGIELNSSFVNGQAAEKGGKDWST